jgi:hypothetical protein
MKSLYTGNDTIINVNLTKITRKVINQDRIIFNNISLEENEIKLGSFINIVLKNTFFKEEYYKLFDSSLLSIRDKGSYFKFRLAYDNKKSLDKGDFSDINYIDTAPQYIKLVLETYANLSFFEREKILLTNIISELNDYILRKKSITFYTKTKNENEYIILPLIISPSKEYTFNYLIAKDLEGNFISIRISNIVGKIYKSSTLILYPTEFELDELKRNLIEYGATFACDKKIKVKVRLSQEGINSFSYSVIHRPIEVSREGNIFSFECSAKQIEYFFFRFCENAEILEPIELRQLFINKYKSGLKQYE